MSKGSGRIDLMLIRHVRSDADDERAMEGRRNSPLLEVGRGLGRKRGKEFGGQGGCFRPSCLGQGKPILPTAHEGESPVKAGEACSHE